MSFISLNAVDITDSGQTVRYVPNQVTTGHPLADGTNQIDIINQLMNLQVNYVYITAVEFEKIWTEYEKQATVAVIYTDWNGDPQSIDAFMTQPISKIRELRADAKNLENVSFMLQEV